MGLVAALQHSGHNVDLFVFLNILLLHIFVCGFRVCAGTQVRQILGSWSYSGVSHPTWVLRNQVRSLAGVSHGREERTKERALPPAGLAFAEVPSTLEAVG